MSDTTNNLPATNPKPWVNRVRPQPYIDGIAALPAAAGAWMNAVLPEISGTNRQNLRDTSSYTHIISRPLDRELDEAIAYGRRAEVPRLARDNFNLFMVERLCTNISEAAIGLSKYAQHADGGIGVEAWKILAKQAAELRVGGEKKESTVLYHYLAPKFDGLDYATALVERSAYINNLLDLGTDNPQKQMIRRALPQAFEADSKQAVGKLSASCADNALRIRQLIDLLGDTAAPKYRSCFEALALANERLGEFITQSLEISTVRASETNRVQGH